MNYPAQVLGSGILDRRRSVICVVVLLALGILGCLGPTVASAHKSKVSTAPSGASSGVKGVSEKRLRAWETKVLGPMHAVEHARERSSSRAFKKMIRNPKLRARYVRQLRAARTKARKAATGPASAIGMWNGSFPLPVFAINTAVLPTGKVLFYAYSNHPDAPGGHKDEVFAYLWDPTQGTGAASFKAVHPPIDPRTGKPVNIWCGGISILADGRVLVTGGNLGYITATQPQFSGLNQVYTFNPYNETWTRQPNMAHGRWYPTQMLMPDGRTVIMEGLDEVGQGDHNLDIEVFKPSPNLDGVGTITKTGSFSGSSFQGDYYPHMFWMPSGRGLIAGPYRYQTFFMGQSATTGSLVDAPDMAKERTWGAAVLEPSTSSNGSSTVMAIGGADTHTSNPNPYENAPATATTESYTDGASGWLTRPSMNLARAHLNTVLLPDGSMVTVGGGTGNDSTRARQWTFNDNHKQVELWSPTTKTWTLGPSQAEGRAYHSTAVLLPDGRVFSAGDDDPGRTRQTDIGEIYEPPYLHRGARPTLTQAPATVGWNTEFTVTTPTNDVTRAVLVAPSAVTHSVDTNQRIIELTMTGSGTGTRTFRSPPNQNIALPGYYMLFVLNADGVPSVAKWVQLIGSAPANQAPVSVVTGSPLSGSVPLTVAFSSAGSTDPDGTIAAYDWDLDGDGQYDDSTVANPSFQYTTAGSYQVRLRVTDNSGGQTVSTPVTVTASAGGGATTTTYVSNLTPTGTPVNGFGPWEKDKSNGESAAGDGRTLTLAGATYAKGLGVHAASDLRFGIPAGCTTFAAQIGLDDEIGSSGSAIFRVLADGAALYTSPALTGASATVPVSVSVSGRSQLQLVVDPNGSNGWDHADWADAKLTCGGGTPANQAPVAAASGAPSSGTVPFTVAFSSAGSSDPDGTIASYAWDLDGDGQFNDSTVANPSRQYTTAGTYTARLRVTDNSGAQTTSSPVTITASAPGNQLPVAVASATPSSGTIPLTVVFSSAGSSDPDGAIASYAWDLDGDGQFNDSTVANPSRQYTTAGTYQVRLRVTDNSGGQTVSSPVTVTASAGGGGTTTTYVSNLTPTGTPVNGFGPWEKDKSNGESAAGDGRTLTLAGVTYAKGLGVHAASDLRFGIPAGCTTFAAKVGVDDEVGNNGGVIFRVLADGTTLFTSSALTGASATASVSVSVTGRSQLQLVVDTNGADAYDHADWADAKFTCGGGPPANQVPVAAASGTPLSGTVPLTVAFSSAGSSDPDGTIASYAWDLDGDGQFNDSTVANPSRQYTTAGTYTVRLRVTDNSGAQTTSSPVTVTASPPGNQLPVATASASPSGGTIPLTVAFSSAGSSDPDGSIAAYAWDLDGDGQFNDSTVANPSRQYTTAGTYTVRLRVTDNSGAQTISSPITITASATGGGTTTTYVSNLTPTGTPVNGFGPWEKDKSNGESAAGDGRTLTLSGVTFAKGIGVHAASDLRFAIPAGCTTFAAQIGLDDEIGSNGSVIFRVLADGATLYTSPALTGASSTVPVSVSISGRSQLQLVVDTNGPDGWDHADWADAKLTCGTLPGFASTGGLLGFV